MASVKQFQVTVDCAEPERVARFWCEVLGYVVPPPPQGFATWDDFDRALPPEHQGSAFACIDPSGAGPRLFFQRVPEGKVVKNRLHLDVRVGTGLVGEERLAALEAECARLSARERGPFASRLVQFAITRVAVPRRANGPDPEPPIGVHKHESSGDRREHPLMPRSGTIHWQAALPRQERRPVSCSKMGRMSAVS